MDAASKKLLNAVDVCVDEMLFGFTRTHPGLCLDTKNRVVSVGDANPSRVALVSGGGSGHEPFAAGYVGRGMLTAAIAGSVFASPPSRSIIAAIHNATQANTNGALVIVPNYTGDCLNFGLAVEKLRNKGVDADIVVVGEDCANETNTSLAGRRGMCGLCFVFKICGSMCESGSRLSELAATAKLVVSSMATIGVGLSACSLPGSTTPLFTLGSDQMELGLGVHGEAGTSTMKLGTSAEVAQIMLAKLTSRLKLSAGHNVAVLINNLGGSTQLEQYVFAADVDKQLSADGINVCRMYVGHLMTSLDAAGFQISILLLPATEHYNWLRCLDAETDAPGWPGGSYSCADRNLKSEQDLAENKTVTPASSATLPSNPDAYSMTQRCLLAAACALKNNEQKLNELDSGCGDGDCGSTLCRLAEGVIRNLTALADGNPSLLLVQLAEISETSMGGTSGAIYSLLLTTSGAAMEGDSCEDWALAWKKGLEGIMKYSGARLGDRTMHKVYKEAVEVPVELKGILDENTYNKARLYGLDKSSYGIVNSIYEIALTSVIFLWEILPKFWNYSAVVISYFGYDPNNEILQSLGFILIINLFNTVINMPFAVYYTFVLEEAHGFNKQTAAFFVKDKLKGFAVTQAIMLPVVAGVIAIVRSCGDYFFVYLWLFAMAATFFFLTVYPNWIAPLFDKYTLLPEGELRTNIEKLAAGLKFPLTKLYVVEGSKRSTHSNAYFYGFFNNKRIVLFDTLLKDYVSSDEKAKAVDKQKADQGTEADAKKDQGKEGSAKKGCDNDEVLAVLGHELGHWYLNHVLKNIIIMQVNLFLVFAVFGYMFSYEPMYHAFGFHDSQPVLIGLLIVLQFIFLPYNALLTFLLTVMSRKFEFQADSFAKSLGRAEYLRRALIKLNEDNLGFPVYDWLYSTWHHSHPPLLERLKALDKTE